MTKEVEVGDEFAGKVVKTTTFGAFVELAKGTDGLLHISNISPGPAGRRRSRRSSTRATRSQVRVVEVDRERGRIGLRLAEDPEIAGKSVEELAGVGSGGGGGRNGGGDRGPRRDGAAAAAAAAATATATAAAAAASAARAPTAIRTAAKRARPALARAPPDRARLGAADRHGGHALRAVRRPRASSWAPARAGRREAEAGLSHFLEHMLFRGTARYGSPEIDQLFDGMGAELNAGTDKEGTTVYARMLDQHLPVAFDVMADMVWRPAFRDVDPERQVVLEEIAMYEDDPQDMVFDVLGEAVFGEHPLGRPIIGRAPVIRDTPVDEIAAFHARRYVPGSIVIAAAGSVDHDAIVELAHAHARSSARSTRGAGAAAGAGRAALDAALPAQGHRAGPRLPRRARAAARRRAPLRAARARRHLRRAVLLAAVPGGARGARARLLRLLVLRPVHRHGRDRALRRHAAGQPAPRRWRSSPQELDRLRDEGVTEEELERARENVKARIVLGLESAGRAHEPPRRLGALRAAAARDRRDHGPHRRRDARGPARAGRGAVGAGGACRPPASAPTRRPSPRPSRPSARPRSRSRRDAGRRRRRRGAHGAGGVRRRRGRRRPGAHRARRPGARRRARRACWATPTSSSTSPRPTRRSATRARALDAGVHVVIGTTGFDLDELRAAAEGASPTSSSRPTSRSARC